MSTADFDAFVAQYHRALGEFFKGNPEPAKLLYSHRDDATLANPFGPPARGWEQVAATMEHAASYYRDGESVGFENFSTYITPDLAYTVEVERYQAKVGGGEESTPVALRVTSILRPDDGAWKIVHRHADPITTVQAPDSILQH